MPIQGGGEGSSRNSAILLENKHTSSLSAHTRSISRSPSLFTHLSSVPIERCFSPGLRYCKNRRVCTKLSSRWSRAMCLCVLWVCLRNGDDRLLSPYSPKGTRLLQTQNIFLTSSVESRELSQLSTCLFGCIPRSHVLASIHPVHSIARTLLPAI